LTFALWRLLRLVSIQDAFIIKDNPARQITALPLWLSLSAVLITSLGMAVAVEIAGARRTLRAAAVALIGIALASLLSSWFLGVDIGFISFFLAATVAAVLIQARRLWAKEMKVNEQMVRSVRRMTPLDNGDARSRLLSGLKLIDTVLGTKEAVVFRQDEDRRLVSAARLRVSQSGPLDPTRNSAWREGIALCEKSIREDAIVVQPSSINAAQQNVAIPLQHEGQTVGALLLRLAQDFEDSDRALLSAVGAQIARNLQREDVLKTLSKRDGFSFLSVNSANEKLNSLDALNGLLSELRFGVEALTEVTEGLAVAYLDGTLAYANPQLLRYAGIGSDNLPDLFTLLDRFRTDVFDEPSIAVRRVLQTGEAYERELYFEEKSVTYGLRMSLVRSTAGPNDGRPLCLAIHVTDLTRNKEHEQLKSDMISLMSHELRTPLTSINGFAELLSADEELPDQAKEFVTIIANESQRLSKMINTFLAVTQLQRKDKQEVLKIPLRLDEVAREIVSTLQPVARKRRIRLVEQPAQRLPPVAADKSLITQAVKNLVSNAIKYSPEKTTVTVSTVLEAEAVRVSVEDRGYGIPAEARERVWEKFYRVVREGQEKDDESTGLGLSFVREVVEQHGGRVELESEEGRGSKFSFTLPRL
jgi:signal transduction histidine kinase